jgi:hypothetical protein
MPLPATIRVKYTEEEAEYVSMRPLVQQEFRGAELVEMVLSVTGKDLPRIQQILRSGTVVFHSYRYWWQGFEADSAGLAEILSTYPEADPSRPFRSEECTEIFLESSGLPPSHSIRFRREEVSRKRLLRARSFWDCLLDLARDAAPAYRDYSYALRGDLYSSPVTPEQIASLANDARSYAPRALRLQLTALASLSRASFLCRR